MIMPFESTQRCERCEVVKIQASVHGDLSHDFIPVVYIDSDYHMEEEKNKKGYAIINNGKCSCSLSECVKEPSPKLNFVEIDKKKSEKELIFRFCVKQGNSEAKDCDGIIEVRGKEGVEILSKKEFDAKYKWHLLLKISTENIKEGGRLEFYARDNSSDILDLQGDITEEILCGVVYFGYKQTCFCNRDFTEEELRRIVLQLRKNEISVDDNGKPIKNVIKDAQGNPILKDGKKQYRDRVLYDDYEERIFDISNDEKIILQDANFKSFVAALNKTFNDFEINSCIRKIHFLAQCYHESQRFRATFEKRPRSVISGGVFYLGRGLIQLTHDYNYKKFHQYYKPSESLDSFVPKVAQRIDFACQASGYFWKYIGAKKGNISQFADNDDVLTVSREINGYVVAPNGLSDRVKYTNLLKEIMEYEKCKNKK